MLLVVLVPRDWGRPMAQCLLGLRAGLIAESYEPHPTAHQPDPGMGVPAAAVPAGIPPQSLGLNVSETFEITGG